MRRHDGRHAHDHTHATMRVRDINADTPSPAITPTRTVCLNLPAAPENRRFATALDTFAAEKSAGFISHHQPAVRLKSAGIFPANLDNLPVAENIWYRDIRLILRSSTVKHTFLMISSSDKLRHRIKMLFFFTLKAETSACMLKSKIFPSAFHRLRDAEIPATVSCSHSAAANEKLARWAAISSAVKMAGDGVAEAQRWLNEFLNPLRAVSLPVRRKEGSSFLAPLRCCWRGVIRYQAVHADEVEDILALISPCAATIPTGSASAAGNRQPTGT